MVRIDPPSMSDLTNFPVALFTQSRSSQGVLGAYMPKIFKKNEEISSQEMLQFGIDHISSGFVLIRTRPDYFDSGGYLIHLGLECILKGWWLELDGQISSEHNLLTIAKRIPDFDYQDLPQNLKSTLERANSFQYLRYPNLIDPIEIGDDVIQPVQELIEHIMKKIPENIIPRFRDDYITKGNRVLAKKRISKAAKKKTSTKRAH